jgi:hypothetical protein
MCGGSGRDRIPDRTKLGRRERSPDRRRLRKVGGVDRRHYVQIGAGDQLARRGSLRLSAAHRSELFQRRQGLRERPSALRPSCAHDPLAHAREVERLERSLIG